MTHIPMIISQACLSCLHVVVIFFLTRSLKRNLYPRSWCDILKIHNWMSKIRKREIYFVVRLTKNKIGFFCSIRTFSQYCSHVFLSPCRSKLCVILWCLILLVNPQYQYFSVVPSSNKKCSVVRCVRKMRWIFFSKYFWSKFI